IVEINTTTGPAYYKPCVPGSAPTPASVVAGNRLWRNKNYRLDPIPDHHAVYDHDHRNVSCVDACLRRLIARCVENVSTAEGAVSVAYVQNPICHRHRSTRNLSHPVAFRRVLVVMSMQNRPLVAVLRG